jgi:heme/copper-type cytochrome/quinol oxidase subunit 3
LASSQAIQLALQLRLAAFVFACSVTIVLIIIRHYVKQDLCAVAFGNIPSDAPLAFHQLAIANAYPAQYLVESGDTSGLFWTFSILMGMLVLLVLSSNLWQMAANRASKGQNHTSLSYGCIAIGLGVFFFSAAWLLSIVLAS